MINFELCDLLVLVGSDSNELSLPEHVGPEGGVGQVRDVVGSDKMKPWLIFVHRVQDCLQKREKQHG